MAFSKGFLKISTHLIIRDIKNCILKCVWGFLNNNSCRNMKIDKDMCILDILYQTEELSYRGEKNKLIWRSTEKYWYM